MSAPSLESPTGLVERTFNLSSLYGIGIVQAFLFFQWYGRKDTWSIKTPVILVMSDSLQLLAGYITAFTVQLYFASRIYHLTRESVIMDGTRTWLRMLGIYLVRRADVGRADPKQFYHIDSGHTRKLEKTKAVTTLQTAASAACDLFITAFLCAFLQRHKKGLPRIEKVMNMLMMNAVNRGALTAVSSIATMGLFLASPDTFWFSYRSPPTANVIYMNSMLATLNMRQHFQKQVLGNEWDTIDISDFPGDSRPRGRSAVSAVEFVRPPPDVSLPRTMGE
ncbi:hypothetical protein K438DRAFT_2000512 [Mycena galopus ATCC 62051]|nr:hypothetical protein K438DRAFT_2000512 [Mycena galopus ATCC 62051]